MKKLNLLLMAAVVGGTMFTSPFLRADTTGPTPPKHGQPPQGGQGGDGQASTQQPRGPRLPPELQRALSQLTLTEDQKAAIKKIGEAFRKKQEALREQLLAELKKVLTPDQYSQVEESFKQPPPPPPPGQGGPSGGDQGGGGGQDGPPGGGPGGGGDNPPPPPPNN